MNALSREPSSEIRGQILAAASTRFGQFGYNKTTMAEIAQDCGMSAANLYRYFDNKLDIGANLACQCLDIKLEQMRETAHDSRRPATQRLREMVFGILLYTHGQWADSPRINEMVNAICEERMDLVDQQKQKEHAVFTQLLRQGVASGEFELDDPEDTAAAIMTATTLFCMPLLMPLYPLEVFEQKADALVRLILTGILKTRP